MIPIEKIKEIAVQCGLDGCSGQELQAFSNAIEAMTIDRCVKEAIRCNVYDGHSVDAIRALKGKE